MIVIICILSVLLLISFYVIFNLNRKLLTLQDYVKARPNIEERAITLLHIIRKLIGKAYAEMKRVDKRGIFSSDDEVGFSFKAILECLQQLDFEISNVDKIIKKEQESVNAQEEK